MKDFFARNIVTTSDGSHTLKLKHADEQYHSGFGAINESVHVFINNAFIYACEPETNINVMEIGFGTGLNALLTIDRALSLKANVFYTSFEPYPLAESEFNKLNYTQIVNFEKSQEYFMAMHNAEFEKEINIDEGFRLLKLRHRIEEAELKASFYNVVYFDAFAPDIQPELWTISVFEKVFNSMQKGGVLTTYSAKGEIRRNLRTCGFKVEKLPGPVGKREITRAIKL